MAFSYWSPFCVIFDMSMVLLQQLNIDSAAVLYAPVDVVNDNGF